jgi:hypothetical protein
LGCMWSTAQQRHVCVLAALYVPLGQPHWQPLASLVLDAESHTAVVYDSLPATHWPEQVWVLETPPTQGGLKKPQLHSELSSHGVHPALVLLKKPVLHSHSHSRTKRALAGGGAAQTLHIEPPAAVVVHPI